MRIIFFSLCLFAIVFSGCSYPQPKRFHPHGILHATGSLRITKIDGKRAIDLSGRYIFRVVPGKHSIALTNGHSSTYAKGKKDNEGTMELDVKEGMQYYLAARLHKEKSDIFGFSVRKVKSWEPFLKKEEKIKGYVMGKGTKAPKKSKSKSRSR